MPPRGRRTPPARPLRKAKTEDWRPHVDKAWVAAREAAKLLPTFTSFARTITGNRKVRVILGDSFKTDGQTIMITPPIALGEERTHDKFICSKRGPDKRMLCPACDAREMLLWPLYHEIGHIAFNSNDPPEDYHRSIIKKVVEEWHPYRVCAHGLLMNERIMHGRSALSLAAAFDPYLAQLTNAFEDARVNSSMFKARAGLRVMFDAGTQRAFESGVEVPHTGEMVMWSDADINAQVVIGLFLIASGYEVEEGYLREEARQILEDEELIRIAEGVQYATSSKHVFELALTAWLRMQKLGVCVQEKCKPAESDDIPSLGNDGGEGGDKANNDKSDDGKPDDGDSGGAGGAGSGGGDGSGSAGANPSDSASGKPPADSARPTDQPDSGGAAGGGKGDDESASGSGGASSEDGADGGLGNEDGPGDAATEPSDVRDGGGDGSSEDRTESVGSPGADGDPGSDSSANDDSSSPMDEAGTKEEGPGSSGDGDISDGSASSSGSEESEESGNGPDSPEDASSARNEAAGSDESETPSDEGAGADADAGAEDLGDPDHGDRSGEDGPADDDGPDAESDDGLEGDLPDEGGSDWESSEGDLTDAGPADLSAKSKLPIVVAPGDPEVLGKFLNLFNCHKIDSDPGDHAVDHSTDGEYVITDGAMSDAALEAMAKAVEIAIAQSELFDKVSIGVTAVHHVKFPQPSIGWVEGASWGWGERALTPKDIEVAGSIVNSATMKARLVFEDNARARNERSLRVGRVDARTLGRRVPVDDDRLFKKKTRPGKKNYAVLIGVDCSGSTSSNNRLTRMKKAVWAQAEMLNRLGIKFAIYGHSGTTDDSTKPRGLARERSPYGGYYDDEAGYTYALQILEVKGFDSPWDNKAKTALASLRPLAANLDGHTMEYYRHQIEGRRESDKVLMYYTDGSMPLENYDEELDILQNQIAILKRKRITTMAVGIDTDAPMQHGLDTCIVRSDEDIPSVVDYLKKRLIG